jgi:glucose-1-phosphate adenylyltransferase
MDYSLMIQEHIDKGADITVGCIEVPVEEAKQFGVMACDDAYWISAFTEKPKDPQPMPNNPEVSLASMGIYVFNRDYLCRKLTEDANLAQSSHDFGKDIITSSVGVDRLLAYPFRDPDTGKTAYWRDVGTIDAYYKANMGLVAVSPELNLYDANWPIYTHQEQLPPAKFVFDDPDRRGMAVDSIISPGCILSGGIARRSVLSNSVRLNSYCEVEDSIILSNSEVGARCKLKKVILDRDCVLPPDTVVGYNLEDDKKRFYVSDEGVVLISQRFS